MAFNFSLRARKLAWSFHDEKQAYGITQVRRVGTDSTVGTLDDEDETVSFSTSIKRISASEDTSRFVSALKQDGCVIIEKFTDLQTLEKAREETESWLQAREKQGSADTKALIRQSAVIRNSFVAHHLHQELCDELLVVETTKWNDDRPSTETCHPVLSSVSARKLRTASSEIQLSRYDATLGVQHGQVDIYQQGRDAMLGLILPGSEPIHVRTALGSHLYGRQHPDLDKDMVEEELKAGDALIVLGSLYQQLVAGNERKSNVEPSLAYAAWSCAGVYRPEERFASIISATEIKTYPEVIQQRLRR